MSDCCSFLGSDMRSLRSLIFWSIYLLRGCSICRFKVFLLDFFFPSFAVYHVVWVKYVSIKY